MCTNGDVRPFHFPFGRGGPHGKLLPQQVERTALGVRVPTLHAALWVWRTNTPYTASFYTWEHHSPA